MRKFDLTVDELLGLMDNRFDILINDSYRIQGSNLGFQDLKKLESINNENLQQLIDSSKEIKILLNEYIDRVQSVLDDRYHKENEKNDINVKMENMFNEWENIDNHIIDRIIEFITVRKDLRELIESKIKCLNFADDNNYKTMFEPIKEHELGNGININIIEGK
jgi:hypothetical protein